MTKPTFVINHIISMVWGGNVAYAFHSRDAVAFWMFIIFLAAHFTLNVCLEKVPKKEYDVAS